MAKKKSNVVTAKKGLSANAWTTIGILALAVVVIGGILVFNRGDSSAPPGAVAADVLRHPDSNTLTTSSSNSVTVVEFLDYQCPVCEAYYQNVTKSLEQDYAGKITFVTRNFPLPMHPLAVPAAKVAEAASLQGKYQPMFDKLYGDYPAWALATDGQNVSDDAERAQAKFESYATGIGLDLARFRTDLGSQAVRQRIDQGKADGEKAGVSGTPTIFVNGAQFKPTGQTYPDIAQQLRGEIDKALT
ncbi:DSBA oxidoreductase [Amycolatopsis sp. NBRC 101858]|uniref:DsbA family protein n=1 Tax=Amycolatopsis sp. NBRC 101858 TaxID=3032200 RepID=UPI0024A4C337|nr:thioredoxin domain-containing protein [Amycolatopsis sp. NBRC 101858]GLY42853.1 DSBA oxidoreductase [Amycolatopsis sp. NBRC 101858]